jgi:hypothetical protein
MNYEIYQKADYWDSKWGSENGSLFNHYQQDLRQAYSINARLNDNEEKILELGAGSFRDFARLNSLGHDCYAMDFSLASTNQAKEYYPALKNKIFHENSFKMSFPDKSFDLSFHNGVWGCFLDEQIRELAIEQVRMTKRRIVFTLHKAHDRNFADYFSKLKIGNDLYGIRFFTVEEAKALVDGLVKSLKIIPVGKGKKTYEDDLINLGFYDKKYIKKSFDYHQMNLLDISERLLVPSCILANQRAGEDRSNATLFFSIPWLLAIDKSC